MRKAIVGMHAGDHGIMQFQFACGHVFWMKPKSEGAIAEAIERWERWQRGDREIEDTCFACLDGMASFYPIGVRLPFPPPEPYRSSEAWIERTPVDPTNFDAE